eukprot:UN00991
MRIDPEDSLLEKSMSLGFGVPRKDYIAVQEHLVSFHPVFVSAEFFRGAPRPVLFCRKQHKLSKPSILPSK